MGKPLQQPHATFGTNSSILANLALALPEATCRAARYQSSFIMLDKECLSSRLHGLLKYLANSSYNMPGIKTKCLPAGPRPQPSYPKDSSMVLPIPVSQRYEIKDEHTDVQAQAWGARDVLDVIDCAAANKRALGKCTSDPPRVWAAGPSG